MNRAAGGFAAATSVVRWRRCDDVLVRATSHGAIVLRADGRAAHTLTGIDHDVWEALAEPSTTAALAARLARRTPRPNGSEPASPGVFAALVAASLHRLAARGVVSESLIDPTGAS